VFLSLFILRPSHPRRRQQGQLLVAYESRFGAEMQPLGLVVIFGGTQADR